MGTVEPLCQALRLAYRWMCWIGCRDTQWDFGVYVTCPEVVIPVCFMDHRSNLNSSRRPQLDLQAAGGVDPARLERALGLRVRRVGEGRYRVWGGSEPHWVDLYTRRMPRCDCGDHLWRERVCKHLLAVMLREGDERVIRAIGELVTGIREEASLQNP